MEPTKETTPSSARGRARRPRERVHNRTTSLRAAPQHPYRTRTTTGSRSQPTSPLTAQVLRQHTQDHTSGMLPIEQFESPTPYPNQRYNAYEPVTEPGRRSTTSIQDITSFPYDTSSLQVGVRTKSEPAHLHDHSWLWTRHVVYSYSVWPRPDAQSLRMDLNGVGVQFDTNLDWEEEQPPLLSGDMLWFVNSGSVRLDVSHASPELSRLREPATPNAQDG